MIKGKFKYTDKSYMQEYADFSFSYGMSKSKKRKVYVYECVDCGFEKTIEIEPKRMNICCHRCKNN